MTKQEFEALGITPRDLVCFEENGKKFVGSGHY